MIMVSSLFALHFPVLSGLLTVFLRLFQDSVNERAS